MTNRCLRWCLALAAGLACLLAPACSETGRAPAPQASLPPARPAAPKAATPAAASVRKPAPAQGAPSGKARRHPFQPPGGALARRNTITASAGALELKGIVASPEATALIQEGNRVHSVRKGEHIGGLVVLEIRDDEVVLGGDRHTRVLSLYQH